MMQGKAFATNLFVGAVALALLLAAMLSGEAWADRHFLPAWGFDWNVQLRILLALRLAAAALGLFVLLMLRPWAAKAVASGRGGQAMASAITGCLAIIAGFGAAEGILRSRTWHSTQDRTDLQEPLRTTDPLLGWRFVPNHEGNAIVDGRMVHYATGPRGYRSPSPGVGGDVTRPTILLAGESIMFGYGLDWPETIGAQLQGLTGLQTATIAISAHGTDQALLRLRQELPRFAHPIAIAMPFMPRLFDRNLDRDRPHLDSGLHWHGGGRPSLRIVELSRRAVHYRSREAIVEGESMTRAALAATIRLARARGATAIILVPQFLPEGERERQIRHDILDEAAIPYLLVPIELGWRNSVDGHPNPRGARAIAVALASALRRAAQPR